MHIKNLKDCYRFTKTSKDTEEMNEEELDKYYKGFNLSQKCSDKMCKEFENYKKRNEKGWS